MSNQSFLIIVVCLVISSLANAKETDQFTDRFEKMVSLTDSTEVLDEWFIGRLKKAQSQFGENIKKNELFEIVQKQFVGQVNPAFQSPIFAWMEFSKHRFKIDRYKPKRRGIYKNTTTKDVGWVGVLGITQTIKINDVLIGKDKIGHFICQGLQYYREYQKSIKKGLSIADANLSAIQLGHSLEMLSQGLKVDGVYSVADLAANWQGFKFWKNLFEGNRPFFQRINGKFELTKKFTLKSYVTHDFDEALNPSYFDKQSTMDKVSANISNYCLQTSGRISNNKFSKNWIRDHYVIEDFPKDLFRPSFNCL